MTSIRAARARTLGRARGDEVDNCREKNVVKAERECVMELTGERAESKEKNHGEVVVDAVYRLRAN